VASGAGRKARPEAAPPAGDGSRRPKHDAEARKKARAEQVMHARIADLESRIADTEAAIREIERTMAGPGFYDDRPAAQALVHRHQTLMWQVGDLMHQWEELQALSGRATAADA